MKFLVHPGFHKTGTSSFQASADQCQTDLEPVLRIMTMVDFPRAVTAARRHSTDPAPRRLDTFALGLREGLSSLDKNDPRAVVITCEKFLGWIPGRKNNWTYSAAPDFMERLVDVIETDFPGAEILLFFTTRGPDAWKRSVYWQNLRSMRITESFEDYAPRLEEAAQLHKVVAAVRDRVKERAQVCAHRVEDLRDQRLGPFGAALEALSLDTKGLPIPKRYNMQPLGAAEAILELNRSDLDDDALGDAKRKLIRDYQRLGLTRTAIVGQDGRNVPQRSDDDL